MTITVPADNQPAQPLPGSPEHDAAMAAKFDERTAPPSAPAAEAPVKPEGIPDKFWNAETGVVDAVAMAKAYTELESKQSQPKVDDKKPEETPAKADEVDPATKALSDKGLNMDDFVKEFSEKSALSDESYTKLAEKGFDKNLVDQFIQGRLALNAQVAAQGEAYDKAAFEVVGGEDNYAKETAWAKANMNADEIKAFNDSVGSGDVNRMKLAVAGLHAKFTAANGSTPNLLGGGPSAPGVEGFASRAEMTTAINKLDEKGRRVYDRDPAYRKSVEEKIARSTAF